MMATPQQPPRALPPAPKNDYTKALSAAMEAIGLAVTAKVHERDDDWRFAEIGRLAKIGEAIGRQKARAGVPGVEGFVPPRQQGFACNVPDGGNYYQGFGQVGNLGGVDPLLDDLAPAVPHPRFGGIRQRNPVPEADDGNPMAFFREVLERIDTLNADKGDKKESHDRTGLLLELSTLRRLLSEENVEADEREVLGERRRQIMELLAELNADHQEEEEQADEEAGAEEGQAIYCLDPDCGTAHDTDWVAADGSPMLCDVCSGPMAFAPVRAVDLGEQLAAEPAEAAG
jgi:hypothetical protein